ncbi:unnamed protein product [Oncorhynchus mykiss]|uniref:Uncharacterized protein n=1 Tax=Oncorhynchus mykiss TaxID=8022 RepID=A0A060YG89_ONCMY|nr:unnamed protein product [Oncorhynchus mykiss]
MYRVQPQRTESYSSCYSVDNQKQEVSKFLAVELPPRPELIKNPDEKRHPALTVDFTFKATRKTLGKDDLRKFKILLWKRYPELLFSAPPQGMDMVTWWTGCWSIMT